MLSPFIKRKRKKKEKKGDGHQVQQAGVNFALPFTVRSTGGKEKVFFFFLVRRRYRSGGNLFE